MICKWHGSVLRSTNRFAQAVLLVVPDFENRSPLTPMAAKSRTKKIYEEGPNFRVLLQQPHQALSKLHDNGAWSSFIVDMLWELSTMLLGFLVVVHTDHKNLISRKRSSFVSRARSFCSRSTVSLCTTLMDSRMLVLTRFHECDLTKCTRNPLLIWRRRFVFPPMIQNVSCVALCFVNTNVKTPWFRILRQLALRVQEKPQLPAFSTTPAVC